MTEPYHGEPYHTEPYPQAMANGRRGRHAAQGEYRRGPDYGIDYAVPAEYVVGNDPAPSQWAQQPSEEPPAWERSAERLPAPDADRTRQRDYPPAVEYLRHSDPNPQEQHPPFGAPRPAEPPPQAAPPPPPPAYTGAHSGVQPAAGAEWRTGDQPAVTTPGFGGFEPDGFGRGYDHRAPAPPPDPTAADPDRATGRASDHGGDRVPGDADSQIDSPTDAFGNTRAPAQTTPTRTEPATPEAAAPESTASRIAASGPLRSGPLRSGPLGSGPLGSGPLGSGPTGSRPTGSTPAQPEAARPEGGTGGPVRVRLTALASSVGQIASGCRALATDLTGAAQARVDPHGTDPARTAALEAARLLGEAAEASEGVLRLVEAARDSLDGPARNGVRQHVPPEPAEALAKAVDHVAAAGTASPNGSGPDPLTLSALPPAASTTDHEESMPPELPATAPSYPPVLPLGLRDGAQAAVVARQVEAARRHLQAALAVGHDVGDPAWRQQILGMIEQVLAAVTEVASVARDALAPSAADTTFPGEARFLCVLPWERVAVAAPERTLAPASISGTVALLNSLGYEARPARGEQGPPQIELRGERYTGRILLQQLRLTGTGEWMAYFDWSDVEGRSQSGVETLGPAEVSDDELARRIDDALRRRLGGKPAQ